MDMHELDILPEGTTKIEALIEKYPLSFFNLANSKKPVMPCELSELAYLGDKIKGLNIILDNAEQYESKDLWPFIGLDYLQLSFSDTDVFFEDFGNLQNWLLNLDNLKAIYFPQIHEGSELTNLIIHSLSANKSYPLIVIYKAKKGKRVKQRNKEPTQIQAPGNRKIYRANKVELTPEGIKKIIAKDKKLSSAPAKELFFSGPLEVEDGEWLLDADGLFFEESEEIIVSLSGTDSLGNFNCSCRCYWQPDEGGFYFASRVPIKYTNYTTDSDFYMSIKFSEVKITNSGICYLKGVWLQSNEQWIIEGELSKNKFKTIAL
ncbi:hypothetical protein H5203_04830 [Pseudoalteromonas sp. SG41-1]|uniref:hypothetical protein n=1 Tax=Pseudoalteromonas TaxID=53246 RepID=UPI0016010A8F|nr:hypothetical protein [Pseudoalteromonas sp. SG41-1]MBB1504804.1 hypothetical protein [Pseudoalteromonas sp. SG41-1]